MGHTDTELLVNCRNRATAERAYIRPDLPVTAGGHEKRIADAVAYLRDRAENGPHGLDQDDLKAILVMLGAL